MLLSYFRKIVNKLGIGLAFVTHDAKDALAIADKVMVIIEGEILQFGEPETIYSNPTSEYVAKITGEINILKKTEIENLFKIKIKAKNNFGLRPENIKIVYDNHESGTLKGQVKEIFFLGEYYRLVVILENYRIKLSLKSNSKVELDSFILLTINQADLIEF